LRSARPGKDADLHLGQCKPDSLLIRDDAAVAGERKLQGAAHAGAVDGGYPGLAARLQLAPEPAHAACLLEELPDGFLAVPGFFLMEPRHYLVQHGDVGAAGERVLARREDSALDAGITCDLVDNPVKL